MSWGNSRRLSGVCGAPSSSAMYGCQLVDRPLASGPGERIPDRIDRWIRLFGPRRIHHCFGLFVA